VRIALVHDWLTGTRGGVKVLRELALLFPEATLFTLFHFEGTVPPEIERLEVRTSPLQRVTSPGHDYRKLLPHFFLAAETWDLAGFDLVISSSHCVAKNAKKDAGAFHLCYAHTPVRYLHDQFDVYLRDRSLPARTLAGLVRAPLAAWDVRVAGRVDAFVANSAHVAARIARLYGRPARVVHPPVDTGFFTPDSPATRRDGLLVVSALAPYKRVDDAIRAALALGRRLTIVGFGPEDARLRALANDAPLVRFAGVVSDRELLALYRTSEALLMPGEEDFGIAPLEAQSCGTPVVALGRGGATETIVDGTTGILYAEPGADALIAALGRLDALRVDPASLAGHTARFSRESFADSFVNALADALAEDGRRDAAATIRARVRNR
jgi:glycosyltransferase involved in cell wall biosynthesis